MHVQRMAPRQAGDASHYDPKALREQASAALHPKSKHQAALDQLAAEAAEKRRRAAEKARKRREATLSERGTGVGQGLDTNGPRQLIAVGPNLSRWAPSQRPTPVKPASSSDLRAAPPGPIRTQHALTGTTPNRRTVTGRSLAPLGRPPADKAPLEVPLLELFAQLREIGVPEVRLKKLVSREQLEELIQSQTGRKPIGREELIAATPLDPTTPAHATPTPPGSGHQHRQDQVATVVEEDPSDRKKAHPPKISKDLSARAPEHIRPRKILSTAESEPSGGKELYCVGGRKMLEVVLVKTTAGFGIKLTNDCRVAGVTPHSAAADGGLVAGAQITGVNGVGVGDKKAFSEQVKAVTTKGAVVLTVQQPVAAETESVGSTAASATATAAVGSDGDRGHGHDRGRGHDTSSGGGGEGKPPGRPQKQKTNKTKQSKASRRADAAYPGKDMSAWDGSPQSSPRIEHSSGKGGGATEKLLPNEPSAGVVPAHASAEDEPLELQEREENEGEDPKVRVRVQLVGHLYPCMTEICLHIVARMAD